jgi:hypothetical protein
LHGQGAFRPVQADDALGPQLLRSPRMNTHTTFDPRRGAGIDRILQAAARQQLHFQLNISEKQEELLNWLGLDGIWAEIIDSSTPGVSRYYRLAAW